MTHSPTERPWRRRLLIGLGLSAPVAVAVWYFLIRDPGPAPVRDTTLEQTGWRKHLGRNWRDLSFALDPSEDAAVGEANAIAGRANSTHNGEVVFDRDDTRADLEGLLARHPVLFHAEHLLATWHRRRGNDAEAARLFAQAEGHAPAVLAQAYRYADGRPLVGATIREVAVECNRVRNGSLDPSLKLRFVKLVTDADGSVRLPVYKTVWRMSSQAYPDGLDAEFPRQGWFESRGKVGLLPVVTVWPKE